MSEYKLTLEKRELTGKKAKNLRKEGKITSVIYGGKEPILASSEYVSTEKVIRKAGYHSPIDLEIEGKKHLAIIKNVQVDAVTRLITNVDFQAVSAKEAIVATAPVRIANFGESDASKLSHFMYTKAIEEIDVKAKPADLPSELVVDASRLVNLEDKLTINDIVLPEGVEFADKELDKDQALINLYDPAAEAAAREAEEAAAAEEATEEPATEEAPAEEEKPAEEAPAE